MEAVFIMTLVIMYIGLWVLMFIKMKRNADQNTQGPHVGSPIEPTPGYDYERSEQPFFGTNHNLS